MPAQVAVVAVSVRMQMKSGWHRKVNDTAAQARRREYDSPEYRRIRKQLGEQVAAGHAICWRCGRWIAPGTAWHVGHDDQDRRIIRGPEHAGENLRTAASKGAAIVNARRTTTSITW